MSTYLNLRKRNDFDFDEDFFNNIFNFSGKNDVYNAMKTDIKEDENNFLLDIDMPGFEKENIKVQLDNGYLNVEGFRNVNKEENNENKKYIRRERYYGKVSRSYYVGDDVKEEDIKAGFKNGVLSLYIPKIDRSKEEKKLINIE